MVVAKLDPQGSCIWTEHAGSGVDYEWGTAITSDAANNVLKLAP